MEIYQLKYFESLTRSLNYYKSAEDLNISRQSIMYAVRNLEKEFSLKLFIRKENKLVLTSEGEQFRKAIIPLLTQYKNTVEKIHDIKEKPEYINIFISPAWNIMPMFNIMAMLSEHSKRFVQDKMPNAQVLVNYDFGIKEIFQELDRKSNSIGIVLQEGPVSDKYHSVVIKRLPMVLIVHNEFELISKGKLTQKDLCEIELPFVHLDEMGEAARYFSSILIRNGVCNRCRCLNIYEAYHKIYSGEAVMICIKELFYDYAQFVHVLPIEDLFLDLMLVSSSEVFEQNFIEELAGFMISGYETIQKAIR